MGREGQEGQLVWGWGWRTFDPTPSRLLLNQTLFQASPGVLWDPLAQQATLTPTLLQHHFCARKETALWGDGGPGPPNPRL